ncbi:hypothetical protein F66182_6645 [Fusarium sp. NRRL 66182]|nr:hypothetical protein F66182_6645 [Fusarium sp. NRRL 66182]
MKPLPITRLLLSQARISLSFALHVDPPLTTGAPFIPQPRNFEPRAVSTELSTCGYLNGDPDKERTADSGFNCRVDTRNGLWGFCPTTVLTASDCGLAGSCVDSHECSEGCGMTDSEDLTTFTCNRRSFCSMALLTFGVDQTYSYIACGDKATTEHYHVTPTVDASTTSESSQAATSGASTTISTGATESISGSARGSTSEDISAASQTSSEQDSSSSGDSSPNLGAIIGGAIGGLVVVCGTIIAAIFLLRRNRSRDAGVDTAEQNTPPSGAQNEAKPQEMPADTQHGRPSPVELAA